MAGPPHLPFQLGALITSTILHFKLAQQRKGGGSDFLSPEIRGGWALIHPLAASASIPFSISQWYSKPVDPGNDIRQNITGGGSRWRHREGSWLTQDMELGGDDSWMVLLSCTLC